MLDGGCNEHFKELAVHFLCLGFLTRVSFI